MELDEYGKEISPDKEILFPTGPNWNVVPACVPKLLAIRRNALKINGLQ